MVCKLGNSRISIEINLKINEVERIAFKKSMSPRHIP